MTQPPDRVSIFLKDNARPQTNLCFRVTTNFLIVAGFVYLLSQILSDHDYWSKAPYPLEYFILIQYVTLAMLFKLSTLPLSVGVKSTLQTVLVTFVKIFGWTGLYWLGQCDYDSSFSLTLQYT